MVIKTNSQLLENIDINLFNLIHSIEVSNEAEPEDQELLDIIRTRLTSRLSKRIEKKTYRVKDTGGMRYFPNGVCRAPSSDWNRFVTDGYASINLEPYTEVQKVVTPKDDDRAKIRHMANHGIWLGAACAATTKRIFTQCVDENTTKLRDNPRVNTIEDICTTRDHASTLLHSIVGKQKTNVQNDPISLMSYDVVQDAVMTSINETFSLEKCLIEPILRCGEQTGEAATLTSVIRDQLSQDIYRVANKWRYHCDRGENDKLVEYLSAPQTDIGKNIIVVTNKILNTLTRFSKETSWLEMSIPQIRSVLGVVQTYMTPKSLIHNYSGSGYYRYGESTICRPLVKRFPLDYSIMIWTKDSSEYMMNAISLAEANIGKSSKHDVFLMIKKEINNVMRRLETREFTLHFNEELGNMYEIFAPTDASRIEDQKTGWLIKKESLEELREIFQVNDEMKAIYRSLTGLK